MSASMTTLAQILVIVVNTSLFCWEQNLRATLQCDLYRFQEQPWKIGEITHMLSQIIRIMIMLQRSTAGHWCQWLPTWLLFNTINPWLSETMVKTPVTALERPQTCPQCLDGQSPISTTLAVAWPAGSSCLQRDAVDIPTIDAPWHDFIIT
jgi:hypothetical protein